MRLDFKRVVLPGPRPGFGNPAIVPIDADTGEEIENVLRVSVSSVHHQLTELTVTVLLPHAKEV